MSMTCEHILQAVSEEYGVSTKAILQRCRKQNVAEARQMAMFIFREYTDLSLSAIGGILNRDHATVCHGIRKIRDMASVDKQTQRHMANITDILDFEESAK